MPLNTSQLAALKTELTTDPDSQGYTSSSGDTNSYGADIARLNATPKAAGAAYSQNITNLDSGELLGAVVVSDYVALSDREVAGWNMIMTAAVSGVNLWDPEIQALMLAIWDAGTQTRTNLAALRSRDGSRAEELFGENIQITLVDIKEAYAS